MTQLTDIQIDELRQLQKQTVQENPELKVIFYELDYINPTDERPWGQNYDVGQYAEHIVNFNYDAYNQYVALMKQYKLMD
jgi:hypothetical protein